MYNFAYPSNVHTAPCTSASGTDAAALARHGYSTERVLGRGGFGIVYLCSKQQRLETHARQWFAAAIASTHVVRRQSALRNYYALTKRRAERHRAPASTLHGARATRRPQQWVVKAQEQRLLRHEEVACMSALRHPNLRALHGLLREQARCYLVMPYLDGVSLLDHVNAHAALDEPQVQRIVRQLLAALRYCHAAGVAHRDMKLDNVMLSGAQREHVTLVDFGLAHLERDLRGGGACWSCSTLERDQVAVGSLLYAAPEIYLQEVCTAAQMRASDVYSLGVLAYACLQGALPFDLQQYQRLLAQQQRYMLRAQSNLARGTASGAVRSPRYADYNVDPRQCATVDCACLYCRSVRPSMRAWLETQWLAPIAKVRISAAAHAWLNQSMAPLYTSRFSAEQAAQHTWMSLPSACLHCA